jgi:sarcosine oxidase subunit beta
LSISPLSCDVAIVGGGIVGCSAALALRKLGKSVILIERDLCGSRSSGVNYGGVRRQGRSLIQLPLAQRAHAIWAKLPELLGAACEYTRSGHLKIARSEADLASLIAYQEKAEHFGLGLQIYSGHQLRELYPWLSERVVGGSLCAEDGHANPRLVSPAFARAASQAGAQLMENTQVIDIEYSNTGFTLNTSTDQIIKAPVLLNCAGAWASFVAEKFNEAVPMVAAHPTMAVTEPLPVFMSLSLGVQGGGIYARQTQRGNCVIGGSRGFALDELRARPSREAIQLVLARSVELLPQLKHANIIRTWSGTEGYLPDHEPVIGPSRTTPGLFHGFGFAGAGFQIGPAVGEVLSELATQGKTSTPIDGFSISRFPRVLSSITTTLGDLP